VSLPQETSARIPTPRLTGQRRDLERRIRRRAHGVGLATWGFFLAAGVAVALETVRTGVVPFARVGVAVAAILVLQGINLLIARTTLPERATWDPHYIVLPLLMAAAVLNILYFLMPAAGELVLVAWMVALLFVAGLATFATVVGTSAAMAVGYLAVASHFAPDAAALRLESALTLGFLAVAAFAGVVFERLRRRQAERHEMRRQLSRLALTDPLTDLPNRRHFQQVFSAELERVARYGGICSVAMMDVDFFKRYNDTLGHPAGDEVLRQLAHLLSGLLRGTDFFARYGGEEFALLMVNTTCEEAVRAVERIRAAVEAYPFPDEHVQPGGNLTISAGIACFPQDGTEADRLVAAADSALYRAKRSGRNRVTAHSSSD